jgi:hypothetical protein
LVIYAFSDSQELKKQQRMNDRINAYNAKYQKTMEMESNDIDNDISKVKILTQISFFSTAPTAGVCHPCLPW